MPRFRFEAMDSTGRAQTEHVEAGNADEAREMLRARGLFVTTLKSVPDDRNNTGPSERLTTEASSDSSGPRPSRQLGLIFAAVGLLCAAAASACLVDDVFFRAKATERADAVIVQNIRNRDRQNHTDAYYDVLEFSAAGKQVRVDSRGYFGIIFSWSADLQGRNRAVHRVGATVPVLYPPGHPENARLVAYQAKNIFPLVLLALGLLFTFVGILAIRKSPTVAESP